MEKYSKEIDDFLNNYILPKLGFKNYNEDNIGEIVDYLLDEYEVPFAQAEDAGQVLTKEEKYLFEMAAKAVTEITGREDW